MVVILLWLYGCATIEFRHLVLHYSGIPKEMIYEGFEYLSKATKVRLIYGIADEYLDKARIKQESNRAITSIGNGITYLPCESKHMVNLKL